MIGSLLVVAASTAATRLTWCCATTARARFEVNGIINNQIATTNSLGTVGLDWKVAGFGDFNGDGSTDMMLRNTNTGVFELYDINNNTITAASAIGQVG